jgi:hypothetical protein
MPFISPNIEVEVRAQVCEEHIMTEAIYDKYLELASNGGS